MDDETFRRVNHQLPRLPTKWETEQLAKWLTVQEGYDCVDAFAVAKMAYIAVYDHYVSGSRGFAGKLMAVVWDGGPHQYDVFTFQCCDLVHEPKDGGPISG